MFYNRTLLYVYQTVVTTAAHAVLAGARPYGRLTAEDEEDYYERLVRTTLDERREAAFNNTRKR